MPHFPRSVHLLRMQDLLKTILKARVMTVALLVLSPLFSSSGAAQRKRHAAVGRGGVAVVVDERLAVLRDAPDFAASLLQRMSRGRTVSVLGAKRGRDGVVFYRVGVTRRTSGWLQSEAVVRAANVGDDERLLRLIKGSEGFDRIERTAIFLEMFPRSRLRPAVLLLLGDTAAREAAELSRAAQRRLDAREMEAGGAPVHTYFLNYNGLDRYRRQGVRFVFDAAAKQYHYDGAAWREIVRLHPRSTEAAQARQRLDSLTSGSSRVAK